MSTIKDKTIDLINLRNDLSDNLNYIGIDASRDEKFNTLIQKIYTKSGGYAKPIVSDYTFKNCPTITNDDIRIVAENVILKSPKTNYSQFLQDAGDGTNDITLDSLDLSNVTTVSQMFSNANFNSLTLKNIDFSKTNLNYSSYLMSNAKIKKLTLEDITVSVLDSTTSNNEILYTPFLAVGYSVTTKNSTIVDEIYVKNLNILSNSSGSNVLDAVIGSNGNRIKKIHIDGINSLKDVSVARNIGSETEEIFFKDILAKAYNNNYLYNYCKNLKSLYLDNVPSLFHINRSYIPKTLESFIVKNLTKTLNEYYIPQYPSMYYLIQDKNYYKDFLKKDFIFENVKLHLYNTFCDTVTYDKTVDINQEIAINPKFKNVDISPTTDLSYFLYNSWCTYDYSFLSGITVPAKVTKADYAFCNLSGMYYHNKKIIETLDLTGFDFSECTSARQFLSQIHYTNSSIDEKDTRIENLDIGLKKIIGTIDCSEMYYFGKYGTNYAPFENLFSLEEMPPLLNLGKGVKPSTSENYLYVDLTKSTKLRYECILDILNNLYNLKTSFNAGGVKPRIQTIALGPTNIAKLTPEEIAIATNKYWTII